MLNQKTSKIGVIHSFGAKLGTFYANSKFRTGEFAEQFRRLGAASRPCPHGEKKTRLYPSRIFASMWHPVEDVQALRIGAMRFNQRPDTHSAGIRPRSGFRHSVSGFVGFVETPWHRCGHVEYSLQAGRGRSKRRCPTAD